MFPESQPVILIMTDCRISSSQGGPSNSALFLNEGNLQFRNITRPAGIVDDGPGMADNEGVNFVDINGDGWLDIYILKTGIRGNFSTGQFTDYGANLLYINQQDNTFKEEAAKYGLDLIGLSHTANFFDYDGDGDLDLYMVYTAEAGSNFSFPYYEKPPRSRWLNDQFLENRDGKFVDVREQAGILYARNIGLSVSVADVNQDGFEDIYVANDFFGRDFFYLNNGDKTFRECLSEYFTKTPMSAMGSDFADIDNDGWVDLFVGEMMPESHRRQKLNLVPFSIEIYNKLDAIGYPQYTRNMLQLNQQGRQFRDIGLFSGVHATEWSWSCFFFDADNDGFKDLYVANGILRDMTNMDFIKRNYGEEYTAMADPDAKSKVNPADAPRHKSANYIFRNSGKLGFEKMNKSWGMEQPFQTRGATYADLDADGDQDIILHNMDEGPVIYENFARQQKEYNYLRIRLKGSHQNSFGIGARVEVRGAGKLQSASLATQRGFQSSPEPILHFGLGSDQRADTIRITWPGGQTEYHLNIPANQQIQFVQGAGQQLSQKPERVPEFTESPNLIPYAHRESDYSDFRRERLLIRKCSREGPGIAIDDVNGDGLDDCFIGGAAGSAGQLFLQTTNGRFDPAPTQPWSADKASEDLGCIFFHANGDDLPDLFIASGSNEFMAGAQELGDRLYLNEGNGDFRKMPVGLDAGTNASSVVVASDYDGDGDTDLFVGGRITPGNYSEIPASRILRNDGGTFRDVTAEIAPDLRRVGRVTAALWTDADSDGDRDLAVVGEWMPLTFMLQENGRFNRQSIDGTTGWWNSITGADLDNDGNIDYVAGNHGKNSIFQASASRPLTLLAADFDNNGTQDPVVFKYTQSTNAPFVNRDIFCSQMPSFNNRFYNFRQYAAATYDNIFPDSVKIKASQAQVQELQSCVFMNTGNGDFKKIQLPPEAQVAPVFGLFAEDLNRDGNLDLLLTGNSYSNHYEYGSIDALDGLVLSGIGDGTFRKDAVRTNALKVTGDAKSLSWLKSANGQLVLLAGRSNANLTTFQSKDAYETLKIPDSASYALVDVNRKTRRVEFYRGSGYLSQSGRHLVLTPEMTNIRLYDDQQNVLATPVK